MSGALQGRLKQTQSKTRAANHPASGPGTIFGRPSCEVRALLHNPLPDPAPGRLPRLAALKASKHDRHKAAVAAYEAQRDSAADALAADIAATAQTAAGELQASQEELAAVMSVLQRERIMLLDEASLLAVRLQPRLL